MIKQKFFKTLTKATACTLVALTVMGSIPATQNIFAPVTTYAQEVSYNNGATIDTSTLTSIYTTDALGYGNLYASLYEGGILVLTGDITQYPTTDDMMSRPISIAEALSNIYPQYPISEIKTVYCDFAIVQGGFRSVFSGFTGVEEFAFSDKFLDSTNNIKTLQSTFSNCSSLKSIDLSDWKVDSSDAMMFSSTGMFGNCSSLEYVDLSGLDLTDGYAGSMFSNCDNLEVIVTPKKLSSVFLPEGTWYLVEDGKATNTVVTDDDIKNTSMKLTNNPNYEYVAPPTPPSEYTSDGTHSMLVKADVTSSYTVQIPAIVTLSRESGYTYSNEYEVGAKGVIANDKAVTITPDSNSLTFTGANTNNTVTGSLTQTKTKFVNTVENTNETQISVNTFATTKGKISATFDKVDNYTSSVGFTFGLNNK